MNLSNLLLGGFLILLAINWLEWVAVSVTFLGVWALVTGIVILLEGFSVFNYKVGGQR